MLCGLLFLNSIKFTNNFLISKQKTTLRSKRHRKRCTDCLCFLIFIIFLTGLGIITCLTILDNGLERLIHGYDSNGNICNNPNTFISSLNSTVKREDTTGRPFVFFFNYTDPINARKVCVKACPSISLLNENQFKNYTLIHNYTLCDSSVPPGVYNSVKCPKIPVVKAHGVANRW